MNKMKEVYQDNLIYVFDSSKHHIDEDYLVVIKDTCEIVPIENCRIMHYQDDFESLLSFTLPTKNRKTKQLLSCSQSEQLLHKIKYGVLSFSYQDFPYSVALDHILIDNHIYFHSAKSGYILNGINHRASYLVVDDLGINEDVGTHNHESVAVYGTLQEVTDFATKKQALLQLVSSLAPKHPYNDKMVDITTILELKVDYMIGKTHIR